MSKARNVKSPDHYYFDISMISDLNEKGQPFEDLVASYAKYVLYRAKTFSGRYVTKTLEESYFIHQQL